MMEAAQGSERNLYSLLKVDRDATEEEIHRAYKALSATFHPDKLPPTTSAETREQIQQVFLEFKRANDILSDPVLRLSYEYYGEEGVSLIKRVQQQRRDQRTRKEATVETEEEDDEDDDDEDDEVEANLYERVERLLETNPTKAREELQHFMEQHDYHEQLTEQNQVQLACSMEFPQVVDLKALFYDGRDYLQYVQQQSIGSRGVMPAEERKYYQQRIKEEQHLVDYQINRIRDSQKASVGFTLSSVPPRNVNTMTGGTPIQPKWSMAMGASTDLTYPNVAKVVTLAGKKEEEQKHPAATFVNMVYQPVPDSQIMITANLSNDQSHQFVLGSSRTFADRSAFRYNMTFLTKSPLDTNIIMNIKSFRHVKDIGMTSGGVSMGANGQFLQWNAKWEGVKGTENVHKCSAKVSVGMMQGNSLEFAYKLKTQKNSWLDEYLTLPKSLELSTVLGHFPKVVGMITQEFTSLAAHPTLGFGMEHDISLGCWTWVWEWTYNNSTFRVPIPFIHLGSVSDPGAFYGQKLYHGIYCFMLQSMVADILQDKDDRKQVEQRPEEASKGITNMSYEKAKRDAEQQLAMMEQVAERKRASESNKDGLVILKATYWVKSREVGDIVEGRVVSMDATKQLQFWVSHDGKLSLPSIPKASWLGFYNLQTEARSARPSHIWDWRVWRRWTRRVVLPQPQSPQPQLNIRYANQGYVYEISIGETEALVLPTSKAQLLGHASLLH